MKQNRNEQQRQDSEIIAHVYRPPPKCTNAQ
jgi:hypothetical protein